MKKTLLIVIGLVLVVVVSAFIAATNDAIQMTPAQRDRVAACEGRGNDGAACFRFEVCVTDTGDTSACFRSAGLK